MPLKIVALVTLLVASQKALAAVAISSEVQKKFLAAGGPPKALRHLNCIVKNFQGRNIPVKKLDPADPFAPRCNQVPEVRLNNLNYVVLVDFTVPSDRRRFWLIPTNSSPTQTIARLYTSHGRYNTETDNTIPGRNKNTILNGRYFSNVKDSNASATGFFVTGETYIGENSGFDPKNPKSSLYLHGAETGINDNSCDRAVVIHGSMNIKEKGPNAGVKRMSSGCLMIDFDYVEQLNALIKGHDAYGGTAILTYSSREAALSENYYCRL